MSERLTRVKKAPEYLRWVRVGQREAVDFRFDSSDLPVVRAVQECHSERTLVRLELGAGWFANVAVIPYLDENGEPHAMVSAQLVSVRPGATLLTGVRDEAIRDLLTSAVERIDRREKTDHAIKSLQNNVNLLRAAWSAASTFADAEEIGRVGTELAAAREQLKGALLVWETLGMGAEP